MQLSYSSTTAGKRCVIFVNGYIRHLIFFPNNFPTVWIKWPLQVIPADKTGDFDMIYSFLKKNWKITKWVALGAVILEV